MKSWDIIGYTYRADTYCPAHIIDQLPTGEGGAFDGWALAAGAAPMSTEDNLDEIAAAFGIDRQDERSFDSGDFPKVIFADQFENDLCGACGEYLMEPYDDDDDETTGRDIDSGCAIHEGRPHATGSFACEVYSGEILSGTE